MKIKYYLILFTILLALESSWGQTASIEVKVNNIKSQTGTIRVGLFNNEKDFLKNAIMGKVVKAEGNEIVVIFEGLMPGNYALSVIHDENENGVLDSNGLGFPTEGFAFGNNAMGAFGPPSFTKAKMKVEGKDVSCIIKLKYM